MRKLITDDQSKCVACNRCIRACPVEGANQVTKVDGRLTVTVNHDRCIACGACIHTCRHEVRDYEDDTERFINDLRSGVPISLFAAPANRVNDEGDKVLAWLRKLGVRKIYDVSLGADICTWAHIRLIQRDKPLSVITQPCPAIVNFIQRYEHGLLKYLSPIHSPMLCTAVYMRRYENISENIAALSPCIAKAHEFDDTGYVKYNVTLKKLFKYIREHNIQLPNEPAVFDHVDSAFGRLYSMPGGLKENVEFYTGKTLRVDQAEGQNVVYDALRAFAAENTQCLPAVFDVLNCAEGCNLGTGVEHEDSRFKVCKVMDVNRQEVLSEYDKQKYELLLEEYDRTLRLSDFMRRYTPIAVKQYHVTEDAIEAGFTALGKVTERQRTFDCGACGCDSCIDMAGKISNGLNIADNCIQKLRDEVISEQEMIFGIATSNIKSMNMLTQDISGIVAKSTDISGYVSNLNDIITKYQKISSEILSIATHINIISLNAAIESARAGVHGKAFAVVADEIRNLANKSKETVSTSEGISQDAAKSISEVMSMTTSISEDIEKAKISISIVYQSLHNILQNTDVNI